MAAGLLQEGSPEPCKGVLDPSCWDAPIGFLLIGISAAAGASQRGEEGRGGTWGQKVISTCKEP